MAIYTPKGLKIRFDVPSAFSLIARLQPRYNAKKVLKITEAIDNIPSAIAMITALTCFYNQVSFWNFIIIYCSTTLVAALPLHIGYTLPGMITMGKVYNNVLNWVLLPWAVPAASAYYFMGWRMVLAYFIGALSSFIISMIFETILMKKAHNRTGFAFTASEKAFIIAYRICATKIGITLSINEIEGELDEESWGDTFFEYAKEFPSRIRATA